MTAAHTRRFARLSWPNSNEMQRVRFFSFNPSHTRCQICKCPMQVRLREIAHKLTKLVLEYLVSLSCPERPAPHRYDSLNIVTCGLHKRRRFQVSFLLGAVGGNTSIAGYCLHHEESLFVGAIKQPLATNM